MPKTIEEVIKEDEELFSAVSTIVASRVFDHIATNKQVSYIAMELGVKSGWRGFDGRIKVALDRAKKAGIKPIQLFTEDEELVSKSELDAANVALDALRSELETLQASIAKNKDDRGTRDNRDNRDDSDR
jgi:hypothetical protein